MGLGVLGERGTHRLGGDVAQRHPRHFIGATCDQSRDRVEILTISLHRVHRRLTRTSVGQESGEPFRTQPSSVVAPLGSVGHARQYFMDNYQSEELPGQPWRHYGGGERN